LTEGIALRKGGIRKPILVLGWTPAEFAPQLAEYELTQSVLDEDYARELSAVGVPLEVHAKLDTGMSRTGIQAQTDPEAAAQAVLRISQLPNLRMTGVFTHFAAADMPEKDDFTHWQLTNYTKTLDALKTLGLESLVCHAGNSAVIMHHPEAHFDMVRMGVMMYGLYPDCVARPDGPLKPVMALKARVAQVKWLPAGASISYGCTVQTTRPTRIAVVSAGYADAYPRSLSNRGAYAVIGGAKCPQIGRICMDLCMFDITDAPAEIERGDEVILYGKGGMPMEEVARLAGTINCEPTSLLTQRVAKVFLE
jgi:alanine racemase